jgi:small conductance mechanosensitive channel
LIGLILAGMFQQIVIDFVKGLDIVVGQHYNVGDFVEVDGKFGHVVDFNVKHTRIRTVSGQEFNIPNSRCVPSRRFPDGYVNNYLDLVLTSAADEERAKDAIAPVCRDLNQRIEPIREEPVPVERFDGPQGRVTLRYRVRVLPGCDWVMTDHFIPNVKRALAENEIELAAEPTFFFINRIETFRKLFSRRLTEEEIVHEVARDQARPTPQSDTS